MEKQTNKICPQCGKVFDVKFYPSKGYHVYKQIYCSKSCSAKRRTGENAAHWKGGKATVRDKGRTYILLRIPGHPMATAQGYVREHRLIMAKKLGRILKKDEIVHHRESYKNIETNLALCNGNPGHAKQHTQKGIKGFIDQHGNPSVKVHRPSLIEVEQSLIRNKTKTGAARELHISNYTLYKILSTTHQKS